MKTFQWYILLFALLLVSACSKGKNEGIPSYISINSVELNTNSAQGSNHHFINNLWIETEGENVGVFEFPNVIPVLVSGEREIIINAGVYNRGDYNNREIYPAYKPFKKDITFLERDTVEITPVYEYYDEVDFPLIEDFEGGNIFSGAGVGRTDIGNVNNIEGKAFHIHLHASNAEVNAITSSAINIELLKKVYIEMEFKGTNDFGLGIQGVSNGSVTNSFFFEKFNPLENQEWYKVYYDITNIVNSLNAESFNFYIQALKYVDKTETDIYIDNFKIVVI